MLEEASASAPSLERECDTPSAQHLSTRAALSALVTLRSSCGQGLHPGAIAGIALGAVLLVALLVALPIYVRERENRKATDIALGKASRA